MAAATPKIKVADCKYNSLEILGLIKKASQQDVRILCLPELCITGSALGDLFYQDILLDGAMDSLLYIIKESAALNVLVAVGLPISHAGNVHSATAVFLRGKLLGLAAKTLPALMFKCEGTRLSLAVETDISAPSPALIRLIPAAHEEVAGSGDKRRRMLSALSERARCACVYANAGYGESTTDMVFSGHNLIYEGGELLCESLPFAEGWAMAEIDLGSLSAEPARTEAYNVIPFTMEANCRSLSRHISPAPFIPQDEQSRNARCEEILNIQGAALAKRMAHTNCEALVLGISGGLDSTLALLASVRACEMLKKPLTYITAITQPCFGTTERTKGNAHSLCRALGVVCKEIDISESVAKHLDDIGHSLEKKDTVYENAQARMRIMGLMNIANQVNGLVVGSGDLSELALGFSTYNGDHMSMYGVNAGVPKTLIRHIIKYAANMNPNLTEVLEDILATPVSPELLPHKAGEISQRTEDIVGPYELHDFYLYHVIKYGRKPKLIFKLACLAFAGKYSEAEILKWLKLFYSRFFSQQFKRNCLPEGPKIGSINLSPRGGYKMPGDAEASLWLEELEWL